MDAMKVLTDAVQKPTSGLALWIKFGRSLRLKREHNAHNKSDNENDNDEKDDDRGHD